MLKKFLSEFKVFAMRGNVIDLAVGVVIGSAFKGIVDSLVNDIVTPLIGLIANQDLSANVLMVGEVAVKYGSFLSSVINFILMALVIFTLVKLMNKLSEIKKPAPKEEEAPTTKVCPYCLSVVPIQATRCAHCTSMLDPSNNL